MEEVLGAAVGVLVASTNDGKDFVSFQLIKFLVPLVCDVTFKNVQLRDGNLTVQ